MAKKTPKQREREAKTAQRDLARMQQQAEKLFNTEYDSNRQGEGDFAEIWGKRIGRTLGYAFAIFLLFYLLKTYIF